MERKRPQIGTAAPNHSVGAAPHEQLRRGFNFRSALSLAFADVSPIVALYAIFTIGLFAAGPRFFWAFPIVLVGQLAVAAVFGELSSRWPYAGSVYQWARHVRSTAWGWTAAWAYMWGLTIALSTLSYAAAGFVIEIIGINNPGRWTTAALALAIIAVGTLTNMIGRQVLKVMIIASIICEVVGSVGLGIILLLFYRQNPLSVLFEGLPTVGSWTSGPMLVAIAYAGWAFVGFEAAGSIAEEVDEPERNVPKAIILGLLCVGLIVMFSSAALILAIPNLDLALGEQRSDPVSSTLLTHFGAGIAKPLLLMFVIGFISSFLAVQAAVSRCIWGAARDRGLPSSSGLSKLVGRERMPINAIGLSAAVAGVLVLLAGSNVYNTLVNFTTIGFYIAFGIPVIGAAIAHLKGDWTPGRFTLGRASAPVTYLATVWIVLQTINVAWPRTQAGQPWYISWSMVMTTVCLGALGGVVYFVVRGRITEPIADWVASDGYERKR